MHFSISSHVSIEPFTPPVPLAFCLIAAGFAVVVSFILVGYFSRNSRIHSGYPKVNILKWALARSATGTGTILLIQLTSVLLFVLVVSAGFLGNQNPVYNLAPTFIWVIWWVGVASHQLSLVMYGPY